MNTTDTRANVEAYIVDHPGAHYSGIIRDMSLGNGNGSYHLHRLERDGRVVSRTVGRRKCYYPVRGV